MGSKSGDVGFNSGRVGDDRVVILNFGGFNTRLETISPFAFKVSPPGRDVMTNKSRGGDTFALNPGGELLRGTNGVLGVTDGGDKVFAMAKGMGMAELVFKTTFLSLEAG